MNSLTPEESESGRVAGIDYGTVRIGVAVTDERRVLASPYENYARRGREADARWFQDLVKYEEVSLFVVGLPVHTNGAESVKSREAREFGRWLHQITEVPVKFVDERFTSRMAEDVLLSAGLTSKKRRQKKDMLAAHMILTAYLESPEAAEIDPGPLDD